MKCAERARDINRAAHVNDGASLHRSDTKTPTAFVKAIVRNSEREAPISKDHQAAIVRSRLGSHRTGKLQRSAVRRLSGFNEMSSVVARMFSLPQWRDSQLQNNILTLAVRASRKIAIVAMVKRNAATKRIVGMRSNGINNNHIVLQSARLINRP